MENIQNQKSEFDEIESLLDSTASVDLKSKFYFYTQDTSGLERVKLKEEIQTPDWMKHLFEPITKETEFFIHPDQSLIGSAYIRLIYTNSLRICVLNQIHFDIPKTSDNG